MRAAGQPAAEGAGGRGGHPHPGPGRLGARVLPQVRFHALPPWAQRWA